MNVNAERSGVLEYSSPEQHKRQALIAYIPLLTPQDIHFRDPLAIDATLTIFQQNSQVRCVRCHVLLNKGGLYHCSSYLWGCDSRKACPEDLLSLGLVHPPQGVVHYLPRQTHWLGMSYTQSFPMQQLLFVQAYCFSVDVSAFAWL